MFSLSKVQNWGGPIQLRLARPEWSWQLRGSKGCLVLLRCCFFCKQGAPKLKVAIVGGGLAGLSTAVELLDQVRGGAATQVSGVLA